MAKDKRDETKVSVVISCFPFQGHQNQLLHLSRIITSYNIPVHFVGTPTHNHQTKLRAQGWDPLSNSNLHFHDFPIPSFDAPPPNPNASSKFPTHLITITTPLFYLREPLAALLHKLAETSKRVVYILDFYMLWLIWDAFNIEYIPNLNWDISSIEAIPNLEFYCFHVYSAFSVYYLACTYAGKPVLIDGKPAKGVPPVDRFHDLSPTELVEYSRDALKLKKCKGGNLYNGLRVIEDEFFNRLEEEKLQGTDKHWAIGPFTPISIPENKTSNKYLEWLDKQLPKSVIYVAFGTTTTFPDAQIKEIALGLERSGHNFIWSLRHADRADYSEDEVRKPTLPQGFEQRIEGRGIVIRDWAPQLEILAHPSTGGFLSHCGWNSCMESMSMGIPIAAWPMHSDQLTNAVLMSELLKTCLLVKEWSHQEIVKSDTVEEAVKRLMGSAEGAEMRQRAAELSTAIKQSVKEDGAATREIASFIAHISR